MKNQATSVILLLLLVGLSHRVECAVAKYKRRVSGKMECGSVFNSQLVPLPKSKGRAECQARVTYVDSSDNTYIQDLEASGAFTTNTKGQFSVSLTFVDDNRPGSVPLTDFQVSCKIFSQDTQVKVVTASGTSTSINAGSVLACKAIPVQFRGALFCARSSPKKAISKAKMTTFCNVNIDSDPPQESFLFSVGFDGSKADGTFARSSVFLTALPPTATIRSAQLTCSLTPPAGTSVASNNEFVFTSGTANFGEVLLSDPAKKFCKA